MGDAKAANAGDNKGVPGAGAAAGGGAVAVAAVAAEAVAAAEAAAVAAVVAVAGREGWADTWLKRVRGEEMTEEKGTVD